MKIQWVEMCKNIKVVHNLANHFLPGIGQDLWLCNFRPKDVSKFMGNNFWRDVVWCWAETYFFEPQNPSEIAAQSLWFNSKICNKDKFYYYPNAHHTGIMFLYNIWNKIENAFLSYQQLCEIYGTNCMEFLQYCSLINSVPKDWIRELKKKLDSY